MRSGRSGKKRMRDPFEHALGRVKKAVAADRMEEALRRLQEMEQENLFPEEQRWKQHELMGQLLYWLADLKAALPHLKLAWELPRTDHGARLAALSNYLMYLHYIEGVTNEEMRAAHSAYAEMMGTLTQFSHGKRRRKRIRVGYLSPNLTDHIVLNFAIQLFADYDRDRFEVYLYDIGDLQSEVTDWVAGMADRYVDLSKFSPQKSAEHIYADQVDILFDLAGHTAASGLAALAWKPAPVQISGLGYMATTGLPAVDYFVTDHFCDPEGSGSEAVYVEKLLRLTSQFCYNGFAHLPSSTGTPARMKGYIQFASFNQYAKLQDNMLLAWREIMERVPNARLLLKDSAYGKRGIVRMVQERLRRLGFDLSRITFEGSTRDYMRRYLDVDIALDTYPWPGGGTTCDALYMGVPVVSYYQERHSTRFTYSLLANIGLSDLASERMEDYVATAVALAGNLDLLDALHREMRDRMKASPVMDQERYIREMEECYRAIWAQWEAEQGCL